ncbi:HEAT repeat domain-containing protein [Caldichromatium japonicum]|uniref:HEAT repeat domain-containing protein n=1 Tax=Caldichromatium japonicum TaxID=2699430 RepID=A0A6G7V9Z0_9GAMM|nr:HEAT repeat domain-containing protein [Caldichromatium japonicum]QIK36668.1 HEAT repeat domain-containing protein [Caldichromatium japonicum]
MGIVKQQTVESVQQDERRRPRDREGLIASLRDPNPVARRWAARDLAGYPESASALVERLAVEEDVSVREAILLSLTEIGDQTAVSGLVQCLRSEDAHLRNEAIEAMKLLPNAVAPIMARLLTDPDPDVRIFAVNILESLRHPDVEKWLIEVISEDEYINVCATAVDLLGEVGTEAALAPLASLKARFGDEPYIAFAVDLALKRIPG